MIVVTALGVIFLCYLGVWQLQRAEEKTHILLSNEQHKNQLPKKLVLPIEDINTLRFQRIQLQGSFISSRQFVLDNQIHQHQVGFNILTPFAIENTEVTILVDRGWVPLGPTRDVLPEVSIDEGTRTITGTAYVPFGKPYTLGVIDNDASSWPRLIQYLDFVDLEQRLGNKLLPLTLRLETGQEGGLITQWPLFAFTPKRHLAYAVQWFALAFTLLVIFIVLHMPRKVKKTNL